MMDLYVKAIKENKLLASEEEANFVKTRNKVYIRD